jgi:hypothetical protein
VKSAISSTVMYIVISVLNQFFSYLVSSYFVTIHFVQVIVLFALLVPCEKLIFIVWLFFVKTWEFKSLCLLSS